MTTTNQVKKMTRIALLSTIAFVLMAYMKIVLPIAPSFYKLDFSEVAVLIGGFSMGPVAAIIIEAMKVMLELLFQSSLTGGIGELSNFLIGCSLVVPASLYYKSNKSKKGALIGLTIGTLSMVFVGVLMNYFVLLPLYAAVFKMDISDLVAMGTQITPIIQDKFTFVMFATLPFNLIKAGSVSAITLLVYKKISPLLR